MYLYYHFPNTIFKMSWFGRNSQRVRHKLLFIRYYCLVKKYRTPQKFLFVNDSICENLFFFFLYLCLWITTLKRLRWRRRKRRRRRQRLQRVAVSRFPGWEIAIRKFKKKITRLVNFPILFRSNFVSRRWRIICTIPEFIYLFFCFFVRFQMICSQ